MRLDRLLSIVMLLVNRKRMQAKELAEIFGVSVRTILRDIEAINQAGIPVVTFQGVNGGLGIADNYRIDRNVLCQDDIVSILSALNGLRSTLDDRKLSNAIEKIKGLIPEFAVNEYREKSSHIIIDLTPWGSDEGQKEKISLLKSCIEKCHLVAFEYSNSKAEVMEREVEPMCLVLKGHLWYLYGFCRKRDDYRLFKLSRIKGLQAGGVKFVKRDKDFDDFPWEAEWSGSTRNIEVVLRFAPRFRMIAEERFGSRNVSVGDDGQVIVRFSCPEEEWLYGMILSFAEGVEVLKPPRLRDIIREMVKGMNKIYEANSQT